MSSDSEGKLLMYSIVGFILGLYYFIRAFRLKREQSLIQNTPTSTVRALAMGPVEVYGAVQVYDNKLMRSPFTDTPCVFCTWLVEKYHHGKNGGWKTWKNGRKFILFNLKDETGEVLVNPKKSRYTPASRLRAKVKGRIHRHCKGFLGKEEDTLERHVRCPYASGNRILSRSR